MAKWIAIGAYACFNWPNLKVHHFKWFSAQRAKINGSIPSASQGG